MAWKVGITQWHLPPVALSLNLNLVPPPTPRGGSRSTTGDHRRQRHLGTELLQGLATGPFAHALKEDCEGRRRQCLEGLMTLLVMVALRRGAAGYRVDGLHDRSSSNDGRPSAMKGGVHHAGCMHGLPPTCINRHLPEPQRSMSVTSIYPYDDQPAYSAAFETMLAGRARPEHWRQGRRVGVGVNFDDSCPARRVLLTLTHKSGCYQSGISV